MEEEARKLSLPGAIIAGKYRVEGVLGEGGMGVVLAATHIHLRETVAIKLLRASRLEDAGAVERFMREARAASKIRSEHVVRVFDVGLFDDASPYIVMEHLTGVDLAAYVAKKGTGLPVEEAVEYVLQACEALREAHAQGIVHRDLKPANLFLTRKPDGAPCVKVLDFGVSKTPEPVATTGDAGDDEPPEPRPLVDTLDGPPRAGAAHEHRELRARPYELTRSGIALGSPRYMAPEQMTSPRSVDARADVWSLGAVLFELVTGRAAFGADSLHDVFGDVHAARFTRARELVPGVSEELDAIIARCLSVDREQRYTSVDALSRALRRVARGSRGRRWRAIGLGAAGAVLAAGAVTAVVATRPRSGPARSAAPPAAPAPTIAAARALAHGGDCAELPAFASDRSVVYLASRGAKRWVERLAPGESAPRVLVECGGACWFPAPSGEGRVEFAAVGDATSLGLEIRSVALDGTDARVEATRGRSNWRAGSSLFFIREDHHAVMRHATDGTLDETLVESPSAQTFRALTASPDGSTLAVTSAGLEARVFADVCFGPSSPGAALDCTSAGESSSQRPSFGPDGRAFYFARGKTLVRFDPRARTQTTATLPFAASSLAVSPAGDRLIASACETTLELQRWTAGKIERLPSVEHAANEMGVGPHGELAYPVISGEDAELVVADESGEHTRVLTSGARRVSEAAFSPDGRRIAFEDVGPTSPGIYVVDVNGARSPRRLTSDAGDCELVWLDDDRIVYLHPEPGYAYGRIQSVGANGTAPEPVPIGDGILLGVSRARRAFLLIDWGADGTRFFERTFDGHERELVFAGAPRGMKTNFSWSSSSGRYVTWVGGGGAWVGDVETLRATRLPFDPKEVQLQAVYADDAGRVIVASMARRGDLFAIAGSFP